MSYCSRRGQSVLVAACLLVLTSCEHSVTPREAAEEHLTPA